MSYWEKSRQLEFYREDWHKDEYPLFDTHGHPIEYLQDEGKQIDLCWSCGFESYESYDALTLIFKKSKTIKKALEEMSMRFKADIKRKDIYYYRYVNKYCPRVGSLVIGIKFKK